MPANVVKSKRDERLWREAKAQAAKQGRGHDYAYIMGIYQRMKNRTGGASARQRRRRRKKARRARSKSNG